MEPSVILQALIGSGPVALVLFYWVYQERKERRELQERLLKALDKQAGLAESVHVALLASGKTKEYISGD